MTIEKLDITSLTAINFLDSSFYNANVSFFTAKSSTNHFLYAYYQFLNALPLISFCTQTHLMDSKHPKNSS